ncbi:MAG: DUF2189 domain-containing protein [Sphingomonadales bacterium]
MSATVSTPTSRTGIRRITTDDLNWALREGWSDFNEKRGDLIFVALLYPLIGLIAAAVSLNNLALPLFFPLIAGISIFGPAAASGFYELAKRREEGRDATWRHFFDPVSGRKGTTIVILTIGLGAVFLLWLGVAFAIYAATMGPNYPVGASDLIRRAYGTPEGWTLIVLGNLAGGVFAVVVLLTATVSFPMAVDKEIDAGHAVETSIHAVKANAATMIGWGARVVGLLVLGALPAFIGLAIVLPVLGYATWHLYTRLIVR